MLTMRKIGAFERLERQSHQIGEFLSIPREKKLLRGRSLEVRFINWCR
jgi:hypothetical protein